MLAKRLCSIYGCSVEALHVTTTSPSNTVKPDSLTVLYGTRNFHFLNEPILAPSSQTTLKFHHG